jgi:hypothetical protein
MLLAGRERALIGDYMFPSLTASPDSVTPDEIDEFVRVYAGPSGFSGAAGLYRSLLTEARRSAASPPKGSTCPFWRSAEALESSPRPH